MDEPTLAAIWFSSSTENVNILDLRLDWSDDTYNNIAFEKGSSKSSILHSVELFKQEILEDF